MQIKDIIKGIKKNTIWRNVYLSNFFTELKGIKQNQITKKMLNDISNIDSICEYDLFAEKVKPYLGGKLPLLIRCYGGESLLYGHLEELYYYAGINKPISTFSFPSLEHGIDTFEKRAMDEESIKFTPNFIFQGPYKEKVIHEISPYKPLFIIGPYVYYARQYYTENKMKEIKKKLGKILLVFPFHCYEFSKAEYSEMEFVNYVMDILSKKFDSVLISVYWNDINSTLYKKFRDKGAILVSSGFRGDRNFIRRLKSLITLSDAVIGNSFGTQIGYAYALDKPYMYYDSELSFVDLKKDTNNDEQKKFDNADIAFKKAFSCFEPNEQQRNMQKDLYEKYWGGKNFIKSPQQVKAIVEIGYKITKYTKGNTSYFDNCVKKLLKTETGINLQMIKDSLNFKK